MQHYVYKITNLLTGKIYVGKHTHKGPHITDHYMGSSEYLEHDISLYGAENFAKEILMECEDDETAYDIESILVDKAFISRKDTYNMQVGGTGKRFVDYEKSRAAYFEMYGVHHPMQLESVQEKIRNTNLIKYGVENGAQSDVVKNRMKQTNLERYGVEYACQHPEIIKIQQQAMIEKYGAHNPMLVPELKQRQQESLLQNHGVINPSQIDFVKEKKRQKSQEVYGVDYVFQAEEVKEKTRQTMLEKYGVDNAQKAETIKEKTSRTNLEKYGNACPLANPDIKQKTIATNLEKYGEKCYSSTQEHRTFISERNKKSKMMIYMPTKKVTQVPASEVDAYLAAGWEFWYKRDFNAGKYK